MRLLLDTHVFYWSLYDPDRLPQNVLETIMSAEAVFVSAASIWEAAIKVRLGKMRGDPLALAGHISESGFTELPIWSRHAKLVATLPMHHSDPFDRLLVAQAMTEPLHLLTADAKLKPYSDLVICF
ncbi:type II toxin-antitoxin system VapC family toxin [Occallatibacter savannae]|uniref:type II toxin-antitoxin system VapC family toxin n=1 Tax=Occallatibacter savannae TaxID=1002691 RepID=UPI000D697C1E|nr:type II toxin-antitoxin system VapC family toxin [Occallatibacter savannae]